jgi:hypothetical protein
MGMGKIGVSVLGPRTGYFIVSMLAYKWAELSLLSARQRGTHFPSGYQSWPMTVALWLAAVLLGLLVIAAAVALQRGLGVARPWPVFAVAAAVFCSFLLTAFLSVDPRVVFAVYALPQFPLLFQPANNGRGGTSEVGGET